MFDWSDVRVFLAVCKSCSFTAAGRSLRMDQTTVGRRVAALEAALGAKLFRRGTGGLTLTPAAQEMLGHAREMEDAAHALDRRVQGRDVAASGPVRLATVETFASAFLAPRMGDFHQRYPEISLSIATGSEVVSLSRRQADMAVRLARPAQPGLIARKIGEYAFALYASPAYLARRPGPVARLAGHDVLGFGDELASIAEALWLSERAQGRFVFRSNSFHVLREAARAGCGIACLPCCFADGDEALVRLEGADLMTVRDLWLVVHAELQKQARIRAVSAFVTRAVAESSALLLGRGRHPRPARTQAVP